MSSLCGESEALGEEFSEDLPAFVILVMATLSVCLYACVRSALCVRACVSVNALVLRLF